MSEEPYQTEWFDQEIYPGPDEIEYSAGIGITTPPTFGYAWTRPYISLPERFYSRLTGHFIPELEEAILRLGASVNPLIEAFAPLAEALIPESHRTIQDQDKPNGFKRRPHGPYEGSRYTLHGKRRY